VEIFDNYWFLTIFNARLNLSLLMAQAIYRDPISQRTIFLKYNYYTKWIRKST
jgi:hypothetical protein